MLIVWLGWWNDATTRSTTPPITETSPENTYIPSTLCVLLPPQSTQHAIHHQLCHVFSTSPPPTTRRRRPAALRQPQRTPVLPLWLAWLSCSPLPLPLSSSLPPRRSYLFLHSPSIRNARYITISHALMHDPLPPASSRLLLTRTRCTVSSLPSRHSHCSPPPHITTPSPSNPARADSL